MNNFEPYQLWLLIVAVAYVAFLAGRASGRHGATAGNREQEKFLRQQEAEATFNGLPLSKREEVDRLIKDGKIIAAVKAVREDTGGGLKESKAVVDVRKLALKSSA
ncbi:MAG: hypothetical protein DHS20C05_20150 [Hyphococcus sp.]|nr:MAG: hypothetical protein DHS20C05_20150 [Marinicaulis sp.]